MQDHSADFAKGDLSSIRVSRRELIAMMLGAPALMAGCDRTSTQVPLLPTAGELLGQSLEIGHKIRNGFRARPADDHWHAVQVAIVGGGAAGLSAAWRLKNSGCDDFVVLELEPVPGGTSRSGRADLSAYPWGAHYLPAPLADNVLLISLLREMGLIERTEEDGSPIIAEQFLSRDPDERLFYRGEWIEGLYPATDATPDDLAQLAAFRTEIDRWAAWRDSKGRRAFAIPTRFASDDAVVMELDRVSMAGWLDANGWTSSRLRWLVDYSCRDDYGASAEQTSAWAGLLYFVGRLKSPGAEHQPLITWPEGNGRITNHLAHSIGQWLKTGIAVTRITPGRSRVSDPIEIECFDVANQSAAGFNARHVIFAAPQFLAPRLIEGFFDRSGRKIDEFEYGSWFVANLHLKDRLRERSFPLAWDNVIHDSRSLGYVVSTHQSGRDHGPTILTWYYPFCELDVRGVRERLLNATWAELADVVLTDLERAHPDIRQLTTRLDIFRWGHAMIRPKPGFITSSQRREAQRSFDGIHFANTDLSGVALFEEAFDHGCRAADECVS